MSTPAQTTVHSVQGPSVGPATFSRFTRMISTVLMPLIAIALAGCSSTGPQVTIAPTGITPIEGTVHAVMGQTLVIPVRLGPDVSLTTPLTAKLDDGRPLGAEVFWIGAQPSPSATAPQWMPDPGVWRAMPAVEGPTGSGFWVIVIEPPLDAVGQGFWLDSRRWPINWLDHPGFAPAITSPIEPGALASDRFRLFAEVEGSSPMLRFRSRLIAGELGNIPLPGASTTTGPNEPDRFDDPVIEALALQQQARWAAGISALASHDPDLARRLSAALCRAVEIDHVFVPAWPTDPTELGALLADLLNPRHSPQRRARSVTQWLDEQPAVIAWIADDAGLGDAVSGECVATLAAINVGDVTQIVSFSLAGGEIDLQRIEPGEQVLSRLPCPARERSENDQPMTAKVQVQGQQWSDTIRAMPIETAPPGAVLSPMYVDRTLVRWRTSSGDAAMAVQSPGGAAALLMRTTFADPSASGAAGLAGTGVGAGGSGEDAWAIYAECITGEGPIEGSIRVWIGPSGAPLAVLTVFADGRIEEERVRRTGASSIKDRVSVARRGDRWSCLIPLPRGAIDARGIVRLGIEHIAADGTRSAWPRPMFPWQTEPARAAFDTTAWGSLSIFNSP
jgi:hypothetical protein